MHKKIIAAACCKYCNKLSLKVEFFRCFIKKMPLTATAGTQGQYSQTRIGLR